MKTEYFTLDQPDQDLSSQPKTRTVSGKMALSVFTILAAIILSFPAFAVEIELTVDRIPVDINESFQLTFSSTEEPDDDPDFSPLEKDFEILDQGTSNNVSMINGDFSRSITWKLTLMAKHIGTLPIPSISFGKDRSQPSSIVVNKSSRSQSSDLGGEDLILKVEASPQDPFVQSQVIYTLRLYRKVNISQASLTEPEITDAVVENLGEDQNYNTKINGENYVVTERKYAIFPQKSGKITINPLTLTAQVITGSGRSRFNGFFSSQSTRTQRVNSKRVTLNVRPAPDTFKGRHWLPAKQVFLEETWSGDVHQAKVGEPLTRTLKLLAKGVTVSQLPELFPQSQAVQTKSDGELKSYPDQPVLKEQKKKDNVIALREEKVALIPSKAGTYQLPAIEIPWWNTQTQQMETAAIPAQTITAIAAAPASRPSSDETNTDQPEGQAFTAPLQNPKKNIWMWISVFLAFGWFTTLIYFLNKQRTPKEDQKPEFKVDRNIAALKKACRKNDAARAKNALIQWGREQFGVSSLSRIAGQCDEDLKEQILQLNFYLYDAKTDQWEGGYSLLQAFNRAQKPQKHARIEDSVLQPLYK